MERNKTGVIVLFILAGFFIIAIAMIFNTSVRRESALKHQSSINEKIDFLNLIDLTVYWVGGFPSELENLRPSTKVVMPEEISQDNMPIRSSTFHISIKEDSGRTKEIVPRKYTEYNLIIITTGSGFTDEGKAVLRNCIVDNDIPVLCIGKEACEFMGTLLIHGSGYKADHSIFYRRSEGYKEPFLDVKAVAAGGADMADALCTSLSEYFDKAAADKMTKASEIIASAQTSAGETEETETSETAPGNDDAPSDTADTTDTTDTTDAIYAPTSPA